MADPIYPPVDEPIIAERGVVRRAWVLFFQMLIAAITTLQTAVAGLGTWQTYTPVWTASITNPTNGALAGQYCVIGKYCFVRIRLTFSGATTFGSGIWFVSLPLIGAAIPTGSIVSGSCYAFQAGVNFRVGVTVQQSPTQCTTIIDSAANNTTSNVPFVWTQNDRLEMCLAYPLA